jgi:hypothetical protein
MYKIIYSVTIIPDVIYLGTIIHLVLFTFIKFPNLGWFIIYFKFKVYLSLIINLILLIYLELSLYQLG